MWSVFAQKTTASVHPKKLEAVNLRDQCTVHDTRLSISGDHHMRTILIVWAKATQRLFLPRHRGVMAVRRASMEADGSCTWCAKPFRDGEKCPSRLFFCWRVFVVAVETALKTTDKKLHGSRSISRHHHQEYDGACIER